MSRKTVVLHAGLPKTGTTYLQERFATNRAWLARSGVCYPEVAGTFHTELAHSIRDAVSKRGRRERLAPLLDSALATDESVVLLSSEQLSELPTDDLRWIRDRLGGHTLRFVVFVRRRSGIVSARWKESVRHGFTHTFSEYVVEELLHGVWATLRVEHSLSVAAEVFGKQALRVGVYDRVLAEGDDLFSFFVQRVLGLVEDVGPSGKIENPSLPAPEVELLRAVNCVDRERAVAAGGAGRRAGPAFSRAALRLAREPGNGGEVLAALGDLIASRGRELRLDALDAHWLPMDVAILEAIGPQFLNAASEREIFGAGAAQSIRVLDEGVVWCALGRERFESFYDEVIGALGRVPGGAPA